MYFNQINKDKKLKSGISHCSFLAGPIRPGIFAHFFRAWADSPSSHGDLAGIKSGYCSLPRSLSLTTVFCVLKVCSQKLG